MKRFLRGCSKSQKGGKEGDRRGSFHAFLFPQLSFSRSQKKVWKIATGQKWLRERERIDYRIASLGKLLAEERFVRKTSAERLRSVYLTKYFGKMSRKSALSRNFKKKKDGVTRGAPMKFTILFFRAIRLIEDQAAKKRRRKGIVFIQKRERRKKKYSQSIHRSRDFPSKSRGESFIIRAKSVLALHIHRSKCGNGDFALRETDVLALMTENVLICALLLVC